MAPTHRQPQPGGSPGSKQGNGQEIQPRTGLAIRLALWIPALFSAAILILFAGSLYPVPDGDAIYFLPAIQSFAATGKLANPLVELSVQTDPSGAGRFLFYTPGFPLLFGSLLSWLGADSYRDALTLLACARAASVLLFTQAIVVWIQSHRPLQTRWHGVLAGALVLSNGLFLFASNGRPEILSMLILSIALLAVVAVRSGIARQLILCTCIALLFPISIANGLIGFSFYLFYQVLTLRSAGQRLALLALTVLLASVLTAGAYAAAGLPLADGIHGLALHSRLQLSRANAGLMAFVPFWRTWILFGLLALLSLGMQIRLFLRDRCRGAIDRLWLLLALTGLTCCIAVFGLRVAPIHYNFYAFLPLYQALALQLCAASRPAGCRPAGGRRARRLAEWTLVAAIALALIEPAQAIILYPYFLSSKPSYQEARAAVARLNDGACHLIYTDGLFTLDPSRSGSQFRLNPASRGGVFSARIASGNQAPRCIVALVQEVNGKNQPPRGWPQIADVSDRSAATEQLRALHLLRSPKGYSFRAYRLEPAVPKPASPQAVLQQI